MTAALRLAGARRLLTPAARLLPPTTGEAANCLGPFSLARSASTERASTLLTATVPREPKSTDR